MCSHQNCWELTLVMVYIYIYIYLRHLLSLWKRRDWKYCMLDNFIGLDVPRPFWPYRNNHGNAFCSPLGIVLGWQVVYQWRVIAPRETYGSDVKCNVMQSSATFLLNTIRGCISVMHIYMYVCLSISTLGICTSA